MKANDQRVHFASALADEDVDLNTLSGPAAMDVPSPTAEADNPQSFQGVTKKAKSELAGKWNSPFSSEASRSNARSGNDSARIQNLGVVEVATDVQPSSEVFMWVNQVTITGVLSSLRHYDRWTGSERYGFDLQR